MAFEGRQGSFAYSLFPTFQRQDSVSGSADSPVVSLQEQHASFNMPRYHNAHEDSYGVLNSDWSGTNCRKPKDIVDCDGESGLRRLVSNILDDADSKETFFSEGTLQESHQVWSPLPDELFQYFQSGAQPWQNPTLPQNCVPQDTFGKEQGQSQEGYLKDFNQHLNGIPAKQQLLFNIPNGDRNSYPPGLDRLPPGLTVPNTYQSQKQQGGNLYTSEEKDRRNSQPRNFLTDPPPISDVFGAQSKMNSPWFHPRYEYNLNNNSKKPISQQYVFQDVHQLVNSFDSLITGEKDFLSHRDTFPTLHRERAAVPYEDSMDEHKIPSGVMSSQSSPGVEPQKPPQREFVAGWRETNEGLINQTLNYDPFQDPPDFSPQNTAVQQFSAPLNHRNQYQSKVSVNRQKSFKSGMNMNQFPKQHSQQDTIQGTFKPQMEEEKKRLKMPGIQGEGFPVRSQTNSSMRVDKRQGLSQNLSSDQLGSMQLKRFEEEINRVRAGNTQKIQSPMYHVHNPRRPSNVSINSLNLNSRSTLPCRTIHYGMDMADTMPSRETAAFNSFPSNMMRGRGESVYHGMASASNSSVEVNQGPTVLQLNFYLDECYEQCKCLEKEREKTQSILLSTFDGKKNAELIKPNIPKIPPNPTRVDHLIVRHRREHIRVEALLDKVESLHNTRLHMSVHTALNRHNMAICFIQERRKEKIANMAKYQRQGGHLTQDRDMLLLAFALKDLYSTTKKLRTALCSLQLMIVPTPVRRWEQNTTTEPMQNEESPSEFEINSFTI